MEKIDSVFTRYSKVFLIVPVLCLFFVFPSGIYAQTAGTTVTISVENESLRYILQAVESNTIYRFTFLDTHMPSEKNISVSATGMQIEVFLNKVLSSTNLTYRREGNTFAIVPKTPQVVITSVSGNVKDDNGQPIIGASVHVKGSAIGATTDVSGNFTLAGQKLSPADILVFSYIGLTSKEVRIGEMRVFNVTLSEDGKEIETVIVTGFQNIGKTSFTGSSTKLSVDDLSIKGATDVSRMLEGQVAGVSIQNVSSTFGAAPKVRVRGATTIDGENKPLWVIDGIVHEDVVNVTNDQLTSGDPTTLLGSPVAGLNNNDIESIDVLKDASATALYGARAMNGVVVITTKRGRKGEPVINYVSNYTIQLRPEYSQFDIMNSADQMSIYAELERKGFLNSDLVNASNSGIYGKMYKLIDTYDEASGKYLLENTPEAKNAFLMRYARANTDWFKVLFRNSLVQEHSVSLSSGSDRSSVYASLSYMNDNGWTIADRVDRATGNIRADFNISKKFKIGMQVNGSIRKQQAPGSTNRRSNTVEGSYDRSFDINPFSYALNTSRAMTAYDENGELEYFTRNYAPFNIINEVRRNKIKLRVMDIKATVDASFKFTSFLKWDFLGSMRYVNSAREHHIMEGSNMAEAYRAIATDVIRSSNPYLYDDPDFPYNQKEIVLPFGGFLNSDDNYMNTMDIRNNLTFDKDFGKHSLNVFIGQQIKATDREDKFNYGPGYQFSKGGVVQQDYLYYKQMITAGLATFGKSHTYDRFAAFYGNVSYVYDRRYVLMGTFRYDGSNALGKNTSARWLPTWTVSGKWNVHEEPFMKDKALWVNELALRTSYGLQASMPVGVNANALFRSASTRRLNYYEVEPYINMINIENSELTWEKGYIFNVGVDAVLFKNRIRFVIDIWNKKGFDNIDRVKTSGIGGQSYKRVNYADMKAYGVDVSLDVTPIRLKDFSWRSVFTMGYAKTKVTKAQYLPSIWNLVVADGGNLVGYPVKSLFSIEYAGLDDVGIPLFYDSDGKPTTGINVQSTKTAHLKYEGPVDPPYNGGFSNTFRYKNLSLNIFMTFQAGNRIRLSPSFASVYDDMAALPGRFRDRMMSLDDLGLTNIPAILDRYNSKTLGSGNYPYNTYNFSDQMVAKGNFIRMKTISLSYTLPEHLMAKTGFIKGISLTVAGSNLFLIYADKKLNGMDPEFFSTGGVTQPLQKQISFSLNLRF